MSASEKEEQQDLQLKKRMMRFLWHVGYLPRMNVDLAEPWERGEQYTDIDVLGVRLDQELCSRFVVSECKSGARAKTKDRLFWLSGVMSYFGAERGFFLRTQLLGTKYLELADALSIVPLSSGQLSELEKSYRIDSSMWFGPFSSLSAKADECLSILSKYDPNVHTYVSRKYWDDEPEEQIASLIASCRKINDISDLAQEPKSFLNAYVLSALSLSILRFSSRIIMIPNNLREDLVKQSLLGGRMKLEERRRLLRSFHAFMSKEIKERYRANYPITAAQFEESFVPQYAKYLVDLVVRICENPTYAIHVPRLLDLLAFDVTLGGSHLDLTRALIGVTTVDRETILKPLQDFVAFAERVGIMNKPLSEKIEDAMSKSILNPVVA